MVIRSGAKKRTYFVRRGGDAVRRAWFIVEGGSEGDVITVELTTERHYQLLRQLLDALDPEAVTEAEKRVIARIERELGHVVLQ